MIKSCEDIKTIEDFHECSELRYRLHKMGLQETSRMIRWSDTLTMNSELLHTLKSIND